MALNRETGEVSGWFRISKNGTRPDWQAGLTSVVQWLNRNRDVIISGEGLSATH
ncbi:MAG: hypothetical protein ABL983_22520 [Nitrospira sp.]